ncbi:MAG: hypothetical protein QOJ39_1051 [Candidatus Eremiobacteraeota bacterium]|jgi:hypothetical protein|nr:hypothetical protein [Candidatus Eremiobacteraeota bacterium]
MARYRVCIIAAAVVLTTFTAPAADAAPPASAGVPVVVKSTPHCSAYAPSDWTVSSNPQASALDLQSGDGTMYAGWGVTAINRTMQQFYGPMYGDPDTSIRTLANMIVGKLFSDSGVQYTSAPEPFLNYFTMRRIASPRTQGIVFYRIYPGTAPQFYTESVYFAIAEASVPRARRAIPAGVAVSIRCATQLVPTGDSGPASRGGKRGEKRPGCGGEGNLRGYNQQLGTQYAHTEAGSNYLLDISDYRSTGPDGPGYYKTVGNSLTKLEPGRSDDGC